MISESFPEELQRCWSNLSKGKCPKSHRVVQCYCKGRKSHKSYSVETKAQATKRWKRETKTSNKRKNAQPPKKGLSRESRMKIYNVNKALVNKMSGGHWAQRFSAFIDKYGAKAFSSSGKLNAGGSQKQ